MTEHPRFGHDREQTEVETEALGGCLTRLGWLVVAPIALLFLGVSMAKNGVGALGLESILYWIVVVAAVTIRYVDVVRLKGETMAGTPASRKDWRRYAIGLPAVALAAWVAAVWFA